MLIKNVRSILFFYSNKLFSMHRIIWSFWIASKVFDFKNICFIFIGIIHILE